MNNYLLTNIKKKLKKSLVKDYNNSKEISLYFLLKNNQEENFFLPFSQRHITFATKKFLYNFLLFFSKNFIHRRNKVKSYILFLRFYEYFNSFIFNEKLFFFKKYAIKKRDPFYLNNFFFTNKQVYHDRGFERLKKKRVDFFRKNVELNVVLEIEILLFLILYFLKTFILQGSTLLLLIV